MQETKPNNPRLIVGIIVDQFRYADLNRYWSRLSANGIKRLAQEGTFYTNTFYTNLITQSPVSHATIATGASPSLHGIVGREWYEPLQDYVISSIYDTESKALQYKGATGKKSPRLLKAPAFTNKMKLNSRFNAHVYGIGFMDHDAILSAGKMADAAFWFDRQTGNWLTSDYYIEKLPEWVVAFNRSHSADSIMKNKWDRLYPLDTYSASRSDRNPYEPGFGRFANGFPYRLGWLSRKDQNYEIIRYTPYADKLTLDFTKSFFNGENPGRDSITDYVAVSFTSTEGIADLFGPYSVEHEDAFLRLDRHIADLLEYLDKNYNRDSVLVFLTGAHGAPLLPEYLKATKGNAGYFSYKSAMALLKAYLRAIFGKGNWVKYYSQQQIYLNRTLIDESDASLEEVRKQAAHFVTQFSGVSHAIPASAIINQNFTSGIYNKFQNSYYPNRSGDVLLNLHPGWTERFGGITHAGYNYDTHVPLFWYGWQIPSQKIIRRTSPTQIAPTISQILGLGYPAAAEDEALMEITGE